MGMQSEINSQLYYNVTSSKEIPLLEGLPGQHIAMVIVLVEPKSPQLKTRKRFQQQN